MKIYVFTYMVFATYHLFKAMSSQSIDSVRFGLTMSLLMCVMASLMIVMGKLKEPTQ